MSSPAGAALEVGGAAAVLPKAFKFMPARQVPLDFESNLTSRNRALSTGGLKPSNPFKAGYRHPPHTAQGTIQSPTPLPNRADTRPNVRATSMSFPPPPHSPDPSSPASHRPSATTRGTRPQHGNSASSYGGHTPRRGLTPISATASSSSSGPAARPDNSSQSPSRRTLSPTSSAYGLQTSVAAANRQAANTHPSTSPSHSLTSPPGSAHHPSGSFHSAQRSRAPTAAGSPRLAPSFASLSSLSQATAGGASGSSRLNRHQSPSVTSPTLTSPTSSSGGASSGQLTSLVVTQLNILLSTTKESNFRTQAEKIRKLLDENGMELFETYFKRLLHNSWSLVFPKETRPGGSSAESHQMLAQELDKIATDPQQAEKVAQALDVAEGSNFNYEAFIEHFQLGPLPKTALLLATRTGAKSDQRKTGELLRWDIRREPLTNLFA